MKTPASSGEVNEAPPERGGSILPGSAGEDDGYESGERRSIHSAEYFRSVMERLDVVVVVLVRAVRTGVIATREGRVMNPRPPLDDADEADNAATGDAATATKLQAGSLESIGIDFFCWKRRGVLLQQRGLLSSSLEYPTCPRHAL